ncbi:HPP family protein [Amycolatopsis alba]|uniref:HPP family protein n=1 Tax=Amycolatopsis alba TaxID=76020 RepID=UPI000363FB27|nr:HPP family protein [Amycolatopsis alba]
MTRLRRAAYVALSSFGCIVFIGLCAILSGAPLLFPSLGPTAFLVFASPQAPGASPRNTVLGHLAGVLAGLTGLAVTGLLTAAPDLTHPSWPRIGAAAIALGLTCAAMAALEIPHPPAGATTLIIALGLLHTTPQIVAVLAGVVLIALLAVLVNKLFGVPYPWWRAAAPVTAPPPRPLRPESSAKG